MARKAGGKWAYLRGSLPMLPVDPQYGDVLHAKMRALDGRNVKDLVGDYQMLEEQIDALERDLKDRKSSLEAVTRVLTTQMENLGLDSISSGGYVWTPGVEPYPIVKDKMALRAWAEEVMPDAMTDPQLPWQTLKATVKGKLEGGEELPPGVDVFLATKFSRRKE